MNRRLLSVFFSALVCSTLGHEHLKAHELQTRHHHRSHALGVHSARANQQQCSYVCPVPNPAPENPRQDISLSLVFIKETNVYALVSTSVGVAIILQIGEPIALLVDGKTGVSVVINIDKQTVVHYPAGSNDNLWKRPQELVEYLENLGPLTNVNNWKNGQSFKLNSVTKEVKTILISIIKVLDYPIGDRAKTNPDCVVSLISVTINALLQSKGVLQLVLGKLESSVTIVLGGLEKIVNLVVGLKGIETKIQGGLKTIIGDDTHISLLLAENSGLSSFLDLLLQVSAHVDLTKVLGNILQNPEAILGIAVQLDGGIYYGVSGITAVIHSVQLYAAKKISLEALIDILIQVQAENGHLKITKETWNRVVNWYFVLYQSQISQFKTESSWSTINKFFQDIKDEKLIINGINVSAIINILITTSGNPSLNNVVKVLLELKSVVALTNIIATLYFRLVWFVISGQGLVYIQALLPNITITIDFSSTTSILKQILANVNVLQIVSYLLRLDIVGAITHLPVLGPILNALEEVIKAVGIATEVTVSSALKAVGSIVNDLKDLILYGLGRGGKAPSDSGIAGQSILGGGISVSITTSWTIWTSSSVGSSGPSSTSGPSPTSGPSSTSGASTTGPRGSTGGSSGGSTGGISIGGSSSGGSGSHSGGVSQGGSSTISGGTSAGGSGSTSGGTSIGGSGSSGGSGSGGSSSGGSGSHSGGISIGGSGSSGGSGSGGSSSGGSGSHSGGISIGGSASSGGSGSGGSSSGGSGSHSGGISIGGSASSGGGGSGGSSSGGSGSHSGGVSQGGGSSSSGGSSVGGSGSHSGGISVGGSSSHGATGGTGWSLGNILGGGGSGNGGSSSSHRWW